MTEIYLSRDMINNNNEGNDLQAYEQCILFFIIKGSGGHHINGWDYEVKDKQIHIVNPGYRHYWSLQGGLQAFQLALGKNLLEILGAPAFPQGLTGTHPVLEISTNQCAALIYEFESLYSELNSEILDIEIIHLRCRLILQIITRFHRAEEMTDNNLKFSPLLLSYEELINKYFRKHKQVSFYAEKLHVTPNYLNVLCHRLLRKPANSFIQNRTILEAKKLLQVTRFPIKEIAFDLGFNETAHFSNFFKSHTGISPRKFRR